MFIVLVLGSLLAVVAIAAAVRDIRFDGYRRLPSREADWRSASRRGSKLKEKRAGRPRTAPKAVSKRTVPSN
jgi:hypothetical protein